MKHFNGWIFFIMLTILLACNNQTNKYVPTDSPKQGTINISVDESFKPAIQEQIKVYEASYPGTKINAVYKPEVECFKDLTLDSTRMIIVARGLKQDEVKFFENQLSYKPQYDVIAFDAVAVIINSRAKDSVFTINKLSNILSGKTNTTAIMDGTNATSTVRYLQDSILKGKPFGKNVVAANGSQAVIEAVSKTENAVGFVGLSWVGNPFDKQQIQNLKTIHLALVECVRCPEKGFFAKPTQASVSFAQYPLARPLYFILKENALGLGTGFCNFLSLERGQLIFRRSFLIPGKMNFNVRKGLLNSQ
jgi:phosphate transport system substrate-binding protein